MPYADRVVRDERGMALGLALFALVVIEGIVAGNLLAGLLEQQSGGNTLYVAQAAEAAEAELREALLSAPSTLASLPIGGAPLDLGAGSPNPETVVECQASRLTDNLFLIRARGTRQDADGGALATRTIGLLVTMAADSSGGGVLQPLSERAWVQLY